MISDEIMLKIENVSKIYKLGEIGGTTVKDTLQRVWARIRKKDDPTRKIGAKNYNKGEKFKALNSISFKVNKGERVGIIGHNGAGKSTLLKLISRVTGPSEGKIYLNGRVASMLEVGTGFHPELTGRENIYMNGAILGMTKREIDAKMDDIIEFSEVRQFIDTPVKRYSSGMYVKLAFSVAAHLDSEIMIMDEVLAVGDVAFQNKCLNKMKSVSNENNRTVLYVSHNMHTIRQLCDRVIVLDHGSIIYDGDTDGGIQQYLGINAGEVLINYCEEHHQRWKNQYFTIKQLEILDKSIPTFSPGELLKGKICFLTERPFEELRLRFEFVNSNGQRVCANFSSPFSVGVGSYKLEFSFDTKFLTHGRYSIDIVIFQIDGYGGQKNVDGVYPGMVLDILETRDDFNIINWSTFYWGNVHLPNIDIIGIENK